MHTIKRYFILKRVIYSIVHLWLHAWVITEWVFCTWWCNNLWHFSLFFSFPSNLCNRANNTRSREQQGWILQSRITSSQAKRYLNTHTRVAHSMQFSESAWQVITFDKCSSSEEVTCLIAPILFIPSIRCPASTLILLPPPSSLCLTESTNEGSPPGEVHRDHRSNLRGISCLLRDPRLMHTAYKMHGLPLSLILESIIGFIWSQGYGMENLTSFAAQFLQRHAI